MHRSCHLSTLLLTALAVNIQAANLAVNGSFENTGGVTTSFSINNPTVLPNWAATPSGNKILDCLVVAGAALNLCGTTAFGGGLSFWVNPGPSPDGGNYVAIDGDPGFATPLTQTINGLVVGKDYAVSFYQAAAQQSGFSGATTERFQVQFGTAPSQLSTLMSTPNHGSVGWMRQSLTFTASAASQVLSFLAVGTPAGQPPFVLLDGVQVNQVPEPGTAMLLVLGGAIFPVVRWLRRKR